MLGVVQDILTIGKKIYRKAQQVKANQARCQRLAERVNSILPAIAELDTQKRAVHYLPALKQCLACLQDTLNFLTELDQKHWLKLWLKADAHQALFERLNERLSHIVTQLNLGISAQQFVNAEEDRQDARKDSEAWQTLLQSVHALQHEQRDILQHLEHDGRKEREVLSVALAQMRLDVLENKQGAEQQVQRKLMELSIMLDAQQKQLQQVLTVLSQLSPTDEDTQTHANSDPQDQINLDITEEFSILRQQLDSVTLSTSARTISAYLDAKLTIPYYELTFDEPVGKQQARLLYQGEWCEQQVMIKQFTHVQDEAWIDQFSREVNIMSRLEHPHIVGFYGACLEQSRACLVMEHLTRGCLREQLSQESLTWLQRINIAVDIASAIVYLHDNEMIHRAITDAHIYIGEDWQAKLAEFEFSRSPQASVETTLVRYDDDSYLAPELLQRGSVFTQASDMYSFGLVIQKLYTTYQTAFDTPSPGDAQLQALIQTCLSKEPHKRPSAKRLHQELVTIQSIVQQAEQAQIDQNEEKLDEADVWYERGIAHEQEQEFKKAFDCYSKGVKLNSIKAMTNAASFFRQGLADVQVDKSKAYSLLKKSAEAGHARAQHNLATMLWLGDGVKEDKTEALVWYQKAAAQGYQKSITFLQTLQQQDEHEQDLGPAQFNA